MPACFQFVIFCCDETLSSEYLYRPAAEESRQATRQGRLIATYRFHHLARPELVVVRLCSICALSALRLEDWAALLTTSFTLACHASRKDTQKRRLQSHEIRWSELAAVQHPAQTRGREGIPSQRARARVQLEGFSVGPKVPLTAGLGRWRPVRHRASTSLPCKQCRVAGALGPDQSARSGAAGVPSKMPSLAGQEGSSPGLSTCRPLCHGPMM